MSTPHVYSATCQEEPVGVADVNHEEEGEKSVGGEENADAQEAQEGEECAQTVRQRGGGQDVHHLKRPGTSLSSVLSKSRNIRCPRVKYITMTLPDLRASKASVSGHNF